MIFLLKFLRIFDKYGSKDIRIRYNTITKLDPGGHI